MEFILFAHWLMKVISKLYYLFTDIFQAFAWFSDLLVEHSEIFWSLFGVDMDTVLAEQPPDTWDSFPLFQILNDYLRTDGKNIDFVLSISNFYFLCI